LHETKDDVLVLVGERRQGGTAMEGRIRLYRYLKSNPGKKIQELHTFNIVVGNPPKVTDVPKFLAFHPDGRSFVCITGIKNSVLIWAIEEEMSVVPNAFEISHKYTAVSMSTHAFTSRQPFPLLNIPKSAFADTCL
jgi:hypothetical protein